MRIIRQSWRQIELRGKRWELDLRVTVHGGRQWPVVQRLIRLAWTRTANESTRDSVIHLTEQKFTLQRWRYKYEVMWLTLLLHEHCCFSDYFCRRYRLRACCKAVFFSLENTTCAKLVGFKVHSLGCFWVFWVFKALFNLALFVHNDTKGRQDKVWKLHVRFLIEAFLRLLNLQLSVCWHFSETTDLCYCSCPFCVLWFIFQPFFNLFRSCFDTLASLGTLWIHNLAKDCVFVVQQRWAMGRELGRHVVC